MTEKCTTVPGNLVQWLIAITVRTVHLFSNLNFADFNFQLLDFVVPLFFTGFKCAFKLILWIERSLIFGSDSDFAAVLFLLYVGVSMEERQCSIVKVKLKSTPKD